MSNTVQYSQKKHRLPPVYYALAMCVLSFSGGLLVAPILGLVR